MKRKYDLNSNRKTFPAEPVQLSIPRIWPTCWPGWRLPWCSTWVSRPRNPPDKEISRSLCHLANVLARSFRRLDISLWFVMSRSQRCLETPLTGGINFISSRQRHRWHEEMKWNAQQQDRGRDEVNFVSVEIFRSCCWATYRHHKLDHLISTAVRFTAVIWNQVSWWRYVGCNLESLKTKSERYYDSKLQLEPVMFRGQRDLQPITLEISLSCYTRNLTGQRNDPKA